MKKILLLILLISSLFTACSNQPSDTIDIRTAKKIALKAYPDYDIVSVVTNDYGFKPSYIVFLSNDEFLYVIQINQYSGEITQVRHESLNTSSI